MGKRGRPTKFEPSAADRAKVAELLAEKAPISDLAKLFELSVPTFRKYFSAEIFAVKKTVEKSRPARKVTDEQREKVKRYVGTKIAPEKVALLLGYTEPGAFEEFKQNFALELEIAEVAVRAKVIDKLHLQMESGLVGATNRLEALTQTSGEPGEPGAAANPGYVGKKAAAQADAAAVVASGGKFAPRGAPRLVASGGKPVEGG